MFTKEEALQIFAVKLSQISRPGEPLAILVPETIEKPFGWVFFYNSKKFLETGESRHRLAGNGPVIVNKHDGSVQFFGTNKPPLKIVEDYELKYSF